MARSHGLGVKADGSWVWIPLPYTGWMQAMLQLLHFFKKIKGSKWGTIKKYIKIFFLETTLGNIFFSFFRFRPTCKSIAGDSPWSRWPSSSLSWLTWGHWATTTLVSASTSSWWRTESCRSSWLRSGTSYRPANSHPKSNLRSNSNLKLNSNSESNLRSNSYLKSNKKNL